MSEHMSDNAPRVHKITCLTYVYYILFLSRFQYADEKMRRFLQFSDAVFACANGKFTFCQYILRRIAV